MIQFGLRLHDAEKLPVEQVLPLVRQKGFTCAHVALSKSFKELPCTPSALTPGYALYLRHLFEKNGIGYLRTHYYGGVRTYQWPTIPLALHGVIYRTDGTKVEVCIGEKDDDPVFCISDLLPHLGAKQNAKTLAEGITAEELNLSLIHI